MAQLFSLGGNSTDAHLHVSIFPGDRMIMGSGEAVLIARHQTSLTDIIVGCIAGSVMLIGQGSFARFATWDARGLLRFRLF